MEEKSLARLSRRAGRCRILPQSDTCCHQLCAPNRLYYCSQSENEIASESSFPEVDRLPTWPSTPLRGRTWAHIHCSESHRWLVYCQPLSTSGWVDWWGLSASPGLWPRRLGTVCVHCKTSHRSTFPIHPGLDRKKNSIGFVDYELCKIPWFCLFPVPLAPAIPRS